MSSTNGDVKFIYFDLDDTILDHGHAERNALSAAISEFGESFADHDTSDILKTYHDINIVLWRDYSRGDISRTDLQRERFLRLINTYNIRGVDPLELGNSYLSHYPRHWTFCDGAEQVFDRLAELYPVGIITNGFEQTQRKKLNAFPKMRDKLSATVISETVGFLKPDKRLFEFAADAAGVEGSEILYVGDSFESDIEGATRAGWRAAWYRMGRHSDKSTESYTFDHWNEFDLAAV